MLKGIYMRVTVGGIVPDNANFPNPSLTITYEIIGNAACQARPNAPASLTAVEGGKGIINLAWADRSDNEVNFLIERSTSLSGGFTQIATANADVTAFTDRSAARKTTYYYRVRAINGVGGKSGYSNVASARAK